MIRLLELYPEHLNLNGDRGNLQVLEKRLGWASVDVQSFTHRPGQPLPATAPDFVLIGHGSPAAWRQVYADLSRIAPTLQEWLDGGTQFLAVSSGFAALHGLLSELPQSVQRIARVSKFEEAKSAGFEAIGYRNSDLDLPSLMVSGNFVGTLLHGPLLAKNETLADSIVERLLSRANVTVAVGSTKKSEVSGYASKASELALELASE
jgi:CobQ-like glutamine amidotransferase family enzyme